MIQRLFELGLPAVLLVAQLGPAIAQEPAPGSIRYLLLGAPPGMSQAVLVKGAPLVFTRQLLPLDREGKIAGEGSADRQIEQVLDYLEAVLKDSGSGMDKLVRINVYALSTAIVNDFREHLRKRLDHAIRPAITSVLTPLAYRKAMVAVDAVAVGADHGKAVKYFHCSTVDGSEWRCADSSYLPCGGAAYLSGQPDEGTAAESAVARSMAGLLKTMEHLHIETSDVTQLKVFLRPMTSAIDVLEELQKFFPGGRVPPVVFVEWLAAVPIEIELIAQFRPREKPVEDVVYYTPPEVRPSNTFCKATLLYGDTQIYISGLYARVPSRGEPQAVYLFDQLQEVLKKSGSDMRHLVKGSYYVSDDDAARWIDRLRPRVYDPSRPPAASKVMVHGVGMAQRTMTVDMIAVPTGR